MTVTYVGGLALGDALPGVELPILTAMGDVQAKIAAAASFAPNLTPPSIAADIQANGQILANLQLALSVGIEPPSITVQLDIMVAALAVLQAQLQIILDLLNLFTAAVH